MKKLNVLINLGLMAGIAAPLYAMENETASNVQQPMPSIGCMTNEEVYEVSLMGDREWQYIFKAAKTIAELDALKSMRSALQESEMDPKNKASLVASLNRQIARLEISVNEKKQDLANVRFTKKAQFIGSLVAFALISVLPLLIIGLAAR